MTQTNTQQPIKRANLAFVFSMVGGILILLRGIVRVVRGDIISFFGSDEFRHRFLAAIALNVLGAIAIVLGIIVIIGAVLIWNRMETVGGALVIVFSLLSIFVGSGWLIGLILGVIGGVLALLRK